MSSQSYALFADGNLEDRIRRELDVICQVVKSIPDSKYIKALILGGGYGKGEGGVFDESGGQRPYNDYDLFVITSGTDKKLRRSLDLSLTNIGHKLTTALNIEVDFGACTEEKSLADMPYHLRWMELALGHKVLFGPEDILAALPDFDEAQVPTIEIEKLLINRGAGLLLAGEKLTKGIETEEDRQFVYRNLRKADQALGDVTLMLLGKYNSSCIERSSRLTNADLLLLGFPREVYSAYQNALSFKLKPKHIPFKAKDIYADFARTRELYVRCLLKSVLLCHARQYPAPTKWQALHQLKTHLIKNLQILCKTGCVMSSNPLANPRKHFLLILARVLGEPLEQSPDQRLLSSWPFVG